MSTFAHAAEAVGTTDRSIQRVVRDRGGSLRRRLSTLVASAIGVGIIAAAFVAVVPASSSASTYHFCSGCQIYDNSFDVASRTLTLSYVNYIGTGDRYLGATAVGYSFLFGYNTATHSFNGSCCRQAVVANYSGYTYVTANAHANY